MRGVIEKLSIARHHLHPELYQICSSRIKKEAHWEYSNR